MIMRPPRSTRTDTLFPTRRSSDLTFVRIRSSWLNLAHLVLSATRRAAAAQRWARSTALAATDGARSSGSYSALVLRSEEHTSELQSLMRISYAVFCLKKTNTPNVDSH